MLSPPLQCPGSLCAEHTPRSHSASEILAPPSRRMLHARPEQPAPTVARGQVTCEELRSMMDSVPSGERSGRSKDTSTFSWKTLFKSLLQSRSGIRKPRGGTCAWRGRKMVRALLPLGFVGIQRRQSGAATGDTSAASVPVGPPHQTGLCSALWMSGKLRKSWI